MKRSEFFQGAVAALGTLTLSRNLKAESPRRLLAEAEAQGEDALWRVVRDQFILNPDWTYLNFGGLGSMPLPVIRSYEEWSRVEERAPGAGCDEKTWNEVKVKLARLLGSSCRPETRGSSIPPMAASCPRSVSRRCGTGSSTTSSSAGSPRSGRPKRRSWRGRSSTDSPSTTSTSRRSARSAARC